MGDRRNGRDRRADGAAPSLLLLAYRELFGPRAAEAPSGGSLAQRLSYAEGLAAALVLATIVVMTAKP